MKTKNVYIVMWKGNPCEDCFATRELAEASIKLSCSMIDDIEKHRAAVAECTILELFVQEIPVHL